MEHTVETIYVDLIETPVPYDIPLSGMPEGFVLTYDQMAKTADLSGFIGLELPGGVEAAILAVTYDDGTCGLNEQGAATFPPDGAAWRCLARVHVCWYDPAAHVETKMHSCRSCASCTYDVYDTGLRVPALGYNSSWC